MSKKTFNIVALMALLALSLLASSCSSDEPEVVVGREEKQEISLDLKSRAMCETLSDFYVRYTADVIKYMDNFEKTENVVLSPLSASMALGMLANGVDAQSAQQIYEYLGSNDLNSLNNLSAELLAELPKADSKATMALANSIWHTNRNSLNSQFKSTLKKYFNPEIQSVSFENSEKVRNSINNWIERNTGGLIKNFNENINSNSEIILLNAVYFKNVWARKIFNKKRTHSRVFHGVNGDSEIEFMEAYEVKLEISKTEYFRAVKLPFGNGAFALTIILPLENIGISGMNEVFNADQMQKLQEKMYEDKIIFQLPKFKVDYQTKLNGTLTLNGISNLSCLGVNIFKEPMTLAADISQGCSFQIDETGVEAAATTEVVLTTEAAEGYEPKVITVDRPFYFFINEYSTGACLLSGRIVDL